LDIYELNPRFFLVLQKNLQITEYINQGIECSMHNDDVRSLPGDVFFDFIISGLPLNNFEPQTVEEFLETFEPSIAWRFAYFEYIGTRQSVHCKRPERERR
jgi:phospholipid N-methyltransferase